MPDPGQILPLHPQRRQYCDQSIIGEGDGEGGVLFLGRRQRLEAPPPLPVSLPPSRLSSLCLERLRGVPNLGHGPGIRKLHLLIPGHSGMA